MKRIAIVLTALAASLWLFTSAHAQDGGDPPPTDDEVNAIARQLYCPVCPNTPLDVCETKACQDWRAQIRAQLQDGWSEEDIMDYFVEQYGERVLAEPKKTGFTSLVWILPVATAGIGLAALIRVIRRWIRRAADSPEPDPRALVLMDEELVAQVERELEEMF
jgi:cytochrome c-type biogenesis protein CcmH